jgi:hypothetical protein
MVYDPLFQIYYVSDKGNGRVVACAFTKPSDSFFAACTTIVDSSTPGVSTGFAPYSVSIDYVKRKMYVSDSGNNKVIAVTIPSANPSTPVFDPAVYGYIAFVALPLLALPFMKRPSLPAPAGDKSTVIARTPTGPQARRLDSSNPGRASATRATDSRPLFVDSHPATAFRWLPDFTGAHSVGSWLSIPADKRQPETSPSTSTVTNAREIVVAV